MWVSIRGKSIFILKSGLIAQDLWRVIEELSLSGSIFVLLAKATDWNLFKNKHDETCDFGFLLHVLFKFILE